MRRVFWRFYAALTGLVLLGFVSIAFGPVLERHLFPIRGPSTINDIIRTPQRLCWTWHGEKLRDVASENFDVFLDRSNGDRSFPEVFHEDSGAPWRKKGAVAVGRPVNFRYCILLPPDVGMTDALTLRQTIHYRGLLGLWEVLVAIPDLVSEGAPP